MDDLIARGRSASTTRNALLPLRAICRRALVRGDLLTNPTHGLELPAQRGKRDRIASPAEAQELLNALPIEDRPLWATALYAGLRLGELQGLRRCDIDLARGTIEIHRAWDRRVGPVLPKSEAGLRTVPIVNRLRTALEELPGVYGGGEALVFGRNDEVPFSPSGVVDRAYRIWDARGLARISPHECRHTFASIAIAAGVNIKALQTFMGHASITITLDRYGHLLPGSEDEAVERIDRFLD